MTATDQRRPGNGRYSGWQVVGIVIGVLILAAGCAKIGFIVGGVTGCALGRAWGNVAERSRFIVPPLLTPESPFVPEVPEWPSIPSQPTAYLGVTFQQLRNGARVEAVTPNSPADRAGLRVGDIIRAVDDEEVTLERPLPMLIQSHQPGDRVALTIRRGETTMEVTVELGARESPFPSD